MAEIAVRRKSLMPIWAWVLLALALATLLLWAFLGLERGEERFRTDGPIRDVAALYTPNVEAVAGKQVSIDRTNVLSVTGDRTFWVGEGEGRQVLVILNEVPTPGQPAIEGRYDVNPGQMIAIQSGEVKRFPAWEEARSRWNLDPTLQSTFEKQQVYIEADRLNIKDWNSAREPVQTQPK